MLNDDWLRPHTNIQKPNETKENNSEFWLEKQSGYLLQSYTTTYNESTNKYDKIVNEVNRIPTSTLRDKKIILFYFSASWCPPCKKFTPQLKYFYNVARASPKLRDIFEIVFVSLDSNASSFYNYFTANENSVPSMPWLAFPYDYAKHHADQMLEDAKQRGIPSLVMVHHKTGNYIASLRQHIEQCYVQMMDAKNNGECIKIVEEFCSKLIEFQN